MELKLDIQNLEEISEVLKQLPNKLSERLINSVLRKVATETLVRPIRSALPYGRVSKMGIKIVNSRQKNTIFVGAVRDVYWLRFVERGTKERVSKNNVRWAGIRPNPIIENISDAQIPQTIDKINKDFGKELNDFILKRINKLKL